MRRLFLTSAAVLAVACGATAASGQDYPPAGQSAPPAAQGTPPAAGMPEGAGANPAGAAAPDAGASSVEQVQANPRGEGPASATPPNPATADTPVPPSMPADPSYGAGPYKGALTPPPPEAMNKEYPTCTRRLQDNCRNPGGV